MLRFPTRCVHSGTLRDKGTRGINTPVYTSTSYEFIDRPDTVYPRYLNIPNQKAAAEKIASLEQTETALVLSSGMAAISTVLFSFLNQGDHVVFQKGLYGGTTHFMERELERFGIGYTVAASQEVTDIEACINPDTRMVFIETPSNPLLNITDIEAVAEVCRKAGVVSVIDNTFASPVNQQPSNLGMDIVVHSATKYLGGHSDIQAGAVATSHELMDPIRETGLNFGGSLNALTLYLLERSMKTLHVRVERINDNAMEIALFLATHPEVGKVNYPGLPEHPRHELAARQMRGFGGMMSFEVKGKDSMAFQKELKLIKPSMSLGGLETICSSPAHTSHRHLGAEGRRSEGIAEGLIRLSVGIEDVEDLKADLDQALGGL
jgi:cystathionine beta-lyase